jgi:hypothetical protein
MNFTRGELRVLFEEWKRRYDEDPEGFQSHEAFKSEEPQSYGEGAARYFIFLIDETFVDKTK